MSTQVPNTVTKAAQGLHLATRAAIAVVLVALVAAYSLGVVLGRIEDGSKIDAVHLAVIALTAVVAIGLFQPNIFDRLKKVKLSGFELEMLEKVQEKQAFQEDQIEDIRLILPLLLPPSERQLLFSLDSGKGTEKPGSHALRTELRRLRSMHLVRTKDAKPVGQMTGMGTPGILPTLWS
jgi:hypothetical protein